MDFTGRPFPSLPLWCLCFKSSWSFPWGGGLLEGETLWLPKLKKISFFYKIKLNDYVFVSVLIQMQK